MRNLALKLSIGEKIGLAFGLVGLIFLAVIWRYHLTLQASLQDYQQLQDIDGARRILVMDIESGMLKVQRAERDFLNQRDPAFAEAANQGLSQVFAEIERLRQIDPPAAEAAERLQLAASRYQQHFLSLVNAWKNKGLDHDSGLQGAFRDAVHELEAMAEQLNVGGLYLTLLQIRRSEKDLGLRLDAQYRARVVGLLQELAAKTQASALESPIKEQLLREIENYREAFAAFADRVLEGGDIQGGKGPFREVAHRIEALINAHYVPDLERDILQLRRREKDYLLRHDKQYVAMALQELDNINRQIDVSIIAPELKARFRGLLQSYRRDFLALVAQNDRIDLLSQAMQGVAERISQEVGSNVEQASRTLERITAEIERKSLQNSHLMLWIVAITSLAGTLLAFSITVRITRPLREMAGLLDRLAYEESAERMSYTPGGRDEVNAMAGSVNTIADNRKGFIAWWRAAMLENEATRQDGNEAAADAAAGSLSAVSSRQELLSEEYGQVLSLNTTIAERADELLERHNTGASWIALNEIRNAARSTRQIIRMIAFQGKPQSDALVASQETS